VLVHVQVPSEPDTAWISSGLPGQTMGTQVQLTVAGSITPTAINNLGDVTGRIDTGTKGYAFRHTSGFATELFGTLTGRVSAFYYQSGGEDINALGIIAGFAEQGAPLKGKNEDTSPWAARLTSAGAWETVADGGSSVAHAINNSGVTVGTRTGVLGQGWVNLSGQAYSLLSLVNNRPATLTLLLPNDINDAGQICGEAVFKNPDGSYLWGGGFIATPVP
jgi:hypothetical protein